MADARQRGPTSSCASRGEAQAATFLGVVASVGDSATKAWVGASATKTAMIVRATVAGGDGARCAAVAWEKSHIIPPSVADPMIKTTVAIVMTTGATVVAARSSDG